MTEEVKEVVKEEVKVPEVSDIEQRALSMGWRPKEDWQGNEDDFIDAKEFVRRKPLFDKIDLTSRRLRTVEQSLNDLAAHHAKVKEMEYQRALKDLRQEKRTAMKEGDTVTALELEDKMDELTEQRQQEIQEVKKPEAEPTPQFVYWVKQNDWYLKDSDMHDFADGAALAYVKRSEAQGVRLTEEQVFDYVLDKVKKAYPDKFENPNRLRASTVSSSERGGKSSKSTYKLSKEEEDIADTWEKQGVMSKDDYIKELKAIRGEN